MFIPEAGGRKGTPTPKLEKDRCSALRLGIKGTPTLKLGKR